MIGGVLAAVGVGIAIGVGDYFLVRKPSITGYATLNSGDMTIQNEGDKQTYALAGAITNIKAGDHIKISGKKQKNTSGGTASV